jgi:eukaryotic-like serine/threonine-protein kinase
LSKVLLLQSCAVIFMIVAVTGLLLLLSIHITSKQTTIVAQIDEDNDNFLTYDNPVFGISIQYPSGWGRLDLSFLEDSADIQFYPLNETSVVENVRIQTTDLPVQNMTLQEYTNTYVSSIEEGEVDILESTQATLSGLPSQKIVFITAEGLKTMQTWTIKDDKVYTITYIAEEEDYENYLPTAQRMIESFKINK